MPFVQLIWAELRREALLLVRYPVQSLMSVLVLYIVFLGLVFAGRFIAGSSLPLGSPSIAAAIVGYLLWFFALIAIDTMSQTLQEEAQVGTLEQLCLARWSLPLILALRLSVATLVSALQVAALLGLLLVTTGAPIALRPALTIPLLLTVIGLAGFGYGLAALTLLFKRIGNAVTLMQFALLFLTFIPVDRLTGPPQLVAWALPLAQGVYALRAVAVDGASLAVLAWPQLVGLMANALVYLVLGLAVFRRAERLARQKGLLSHY